MASLEDLIVANKNFYRCPESTEGRKLLTFLASKDLYVTSLTMKFAMACAEAAGAATIVIPNITSPRRSVVKLIKSYFPERIATMFLDMLVTFIIKFPKIFVQSAIVSSGKSILKINIDGVVIGPHIYDYLLTKCGVSSIDQVSIKMRLLTMLELTYYLSAKKIIETTENPLVLLPDNAYRQGMIFELCRHWSLECFAGLSMTEFSIYHYKTREDYKNHCRTPSKKLLRSLIDDENFKNSAKDYLDSRTRGDGQQHDVIRAYSSQKKNISSMSLKESMNLSGEKPLVLVAAHIFRDAPHAYPDVLFDDYKDWLVQTCRALSKNKHVNFVVKEHPSADLYNEEGEIARMLGDIGLANHLLPSDINTSSLMNIVDVLVTCGGTAGMEFACFGVPPILAANPPYSKSGFTQNSETIEEYLCKLRDCHNLDKLNTQERAIALNNLYLINECLGANNIDQLIGTQRLFLGNTINLAKFYGEMIADCQSNVGYSTLVEELSVTMSGDYPHFFTDVRSY